MNKINNWAKYQIFFGIPLAILCIIMDYSSQVNMFSCFLLGFAFTSLIYELTESGHLPLVRKKFVKGEQHETNTITKEVYKK